MAFVGLLVTLAGTVISIASLGFADSTGLRLIMVLVGIAVSLFGICGMINRAYLQHAIWKKEN